MSKLRFLFSAIFIGITLYLPAQSPKTPLSRVINVSGTTQIAPSLSGDGKHMIFISTSNLKSELLVFYSFQQRPGKWTQPEPVAAINRSLPINHIGGYSLSYDGNYIFFTSRKSYGIGKYDIWYSKKTGKNQWSSPTNLAKPVNSALDDGCPSVSPDGRTLYFVRCQSMDQQEGTGCQLMVSEKRNQELWGEPTALPDYINDGNIMSPRILADNQTLIYAKGQGDHWDLYQTRLVSGSWSKPVALDYVNSPGAERFASIPAQGDVIYYSAKFKGDYDIIKAKIPPAMQPNKVLYLKGAVTDNQGAPMEAFIQVYDVDQKKLDQYYRTEQNNSGFELYLAAGRQYDFSIVSLDEGYAFYSEEFDLRDLSVSTRRKMDISLDPLVSGASFQLPCLYFENDSTLSPSSRFELSRVIKLLKNNPGIKVEIAVHREYLPPDTVSTPEVQLLVEAPDDSTFVEEPVITESSLNVLDEALVNSVDSVHQELPSPPRDLTEIQAEVISHYLQQRGVPDYILTVKGYADSEPLVENENSTDSLQNRRIELKVL